jgi:hypothetical protein
MMPELVRIGGLTLYTYGFMWVVGIWLAVWWGAAPRTTLWGLTRRRARCRLLERPDGYSRRACGVRADQLVAVRA